MIDFAQVFERSPNPYMLVDRNLRYVTANPAYLALTASRLEDLVGRGLFDAFPNDPDDPDNLPARMLRASFERVLATGERDVLAWIPYRVPKYVNGALVTRYRVFSASHEPILGPDGDVAYILQHTVDVSALAEDGATGEEPRPAPLAVGVLDRAEAVQEANFTLSSEREYLRALFDQAPGFMAFLDGPDHVFRHANRAYVAVVGERALVGRPIREALPELRDQGFFEILDAVYATGAPYVGSDVRLELARSRPDALEETFVDFVYQPIRDADGRVRGIFVQGSDVTPRRIARRESEAARRAAEAFSAELVEQSERVRVALDAAHARIRDLEAQLAR